MENIITHLSKQFSMSLSAAKKLAALMTIVDVHKNVVFVEKDRNNTKEYFLLEGLCRSYLYNANGDEVTLSFFTPNTAISPNLIRTKSDISILNIQALTNIKMTSFSSKELLALMHSDREIEVWANTVLQTVLLQKVSKEINQISMNAKERLVAFRSEYPALENLIPHSYISSYLGITNVSLSRLRKELST